jgi:hypothetical protein
MGPQWVACSAQSAGRRALHSRVPGPWGLSVGTVLSLRAYSPSRPGRAKLPPGGAWAAGGGAWAPAAQAHWHCLAGSAAALTLPE